MSSGTHVPSALSAPPQQLPPIAEEGKSTAGEAASGEGASSQGVGRVKDLYSESDLDMTEVWPSVPPATREAPAVEPGAGVKGGAEGNPPTSSFSLGRANFGGINGSSSSSSSDDSRANSDSSNSTDSGYVPALVGRSAPDLEVFVDLPALQSGRTRFQSRGLAMSASCVDLLLAYAMWIVEDKKAVEEEAAETERADDSLQVERLEKKREELEELKRRGALLEQREKEQDSVCPLAMAVEQQPELSIQSTIGRKSSEVESPPHAVAGVERSVYGKSWEQAMQSEFTGHMKAGTISMVDRVPDGRKPVSSKWYFDYKTDKGGKITKLKARLVAREFTQIRNVGYTYSYSLCPPSASIKLVLIVANERGLILFHFDVAQAYIWAWVDKKRLT